MQPQLQVAMRGWHGRDHRCLIGPRHPNIHKYARLVPLWRHRQQGQGAIGRRDSLRRVERQLERAEPIASLFGLPFLGTTKSGPTQLFGRNVVHVPDCPLALAIFSPKGLTPIPTQTKCLNPSTTTTKRLSLYNVGRGLLTLSAAPGLVLPQKLHGLWPATATWPRMDLD
jgi:hypothetical protein